MNCNLFPTYIILHYIHGNLTERVKAFWNGFHFWFRYKLTLQSAYIFYPRLLTKLGTQTIYWIQYTQETPICGISGIPKSLPWAGTKQLLFLVAKKNVPLRIHFTKPTPIRTKLKPLRQTISATDVLNGDLNCFHENVILYWMYDGKF